MDRQTEKGHQRIITGDAPSATVYEDLLVTAFLDINPLADFHTLVIPRRHYARLDEIDDESAAALGVALKKVAGALVRVTGSPDYNILLANGPSAGQEVWHVHYHVIPRAPKDGLGFRWKTQQLPPQTEIDVFLSKMHCELRTAEMGKTVDEALMM